MPDPVERRRCLVGQDACDVAQRGLSGISVRDRRPEGTVQVAEAGTVAEEVLLRRVGGAETGPGCVGGMLC